MFRLAGFFVVSEEILDTGHVTTLVDRVVDGCVALIYTTRPKEHY